MSTLIGDVQKSLQNLFGSFHKKPTSVLGIDIGSSSIKIVQLKKEAGKVVLETYGAIALGPYGSMQPGELPNLAVPAKVQALKDLLKESNATSNHAGFSIHSDVSLIFLLELPSVPETELKTVVPNEARKYIPVPLAEVSLDWWVVPQDPYAVVEGAGKTEVLVVAVRNDALTSYGEVVQQSGLVSTTYELELFDSIRSSFQHELKPVMIIDWGGKATRVAIVEFGVIRSFNIITRGGAQMTQALATSLGIPFAKAEIAKKEIMLEKTEDKSVQVINTSLQYVVSEIRSLLLQYEKKHQKSVGLIYMTGGGALLGGLPQYIETAFTIPTERVQPFQKTQAPEFLNEVLAKAGPEFSVAIGVALKQLEEA